MQYLGFIMDEVLYGIVGEPEYTPSSDEELKSEELKSEEKRWLPAYMKYAEFHGVSCGTDIFKACNKDHASKIEKKNVRRLVECDCSATTYEEQYGDDHNHDRYSDYDSKHPVHEDAQHVYVIGNTKCSGGTKVRVVFPEIDQIGFISMRKPTIRVESC